MLTLSRRSLVACLLTTLAWVGCADSEPVVNRVQPNVVDKSMFEGNWYFRQTVIDTPYSVGFTFVGDQGEVTKIKWEIQEQYLIARRSFEWISGSEGTGIGGSSDQSGAVVAMYKIDKHFDIRRTYNTVTGEEENVLVENDEDRPWNQRDFMRVDWSKNLVTDTTFMMVARVFDGISMEPVSYYVQDPNDPNRPRFEKNEAGEVSYIDIVNKMFVQPESVTFPGEGTFPVCYLLYENHRDCAPAEIGVRNSFLKIDETRDYQPMVYTGDRMERFGYFVTERPGYDPHYGVVEPARMRFVNRHNLWVRSHKPGTDGHGIACSTDAQCADGRGSVCDMDLARARHTQTGLCTIPFRDREVRPVAYHLSSNFPETLNPDAAHLSDEWASALRDTIASLRENECLANGGNAASCASERTREDAAHPFVLCHSPVRAGESTACGPVGTEARPGDLRYSMIGYVSEPHLSSPLGFGPSAADQETGEIIQGNAFVYGAGIETLASFARDIVGLLNGTLTRDEVLNGTNIEEWVARQTQGGSAVTGRPADDHVVPVDGLDAHRINAAMDFSWTGAGSAGTRGAPRNARELIERMQQSRERLERGGVFGRGDDRGVARLSNLHGTDIERMMTGVEMRSAAGVDPRLPVDDDILDAASPLRGLSTEAIRARREARMRLQKDSCVLGADFADEGMLGLARSLQDALSDGSCAVQWYGQSYPVCGRDSRGRAILDDELVRAVLIHPIFEAVTAHEVGHTLGLRHNFSGSYDSLNYQQRYWDLRDDGTMAPRAWDPMTEAELHGRIREYQYSTVMDYGNNFVVTDANGIGHYDRAAIKMGYGDMVEVFANAENPSEMAWIHFIQAQGWPVLLKLDSFGAGEPQAYQYTDVPQVLGGVSRLSQRADVPYKSLVADTELSSQGVDDPLVDAQGRPAVPYLFCSDEQADLGPDCMRYDAGADPYETLQSVIDTYWNYYIFHSFRRERLGFSIGPYADRILGRYFEKLQSANQIYALYRPIFTDVFGQSAALDRFYERPDGMGAWTLGVGASYELLTRVVAAPEPGNYGRTTRADGTVALTADAPTADTRVAVFDGRYIETTWNFDDGYYWFDQLERAGYFYDKVIALQVLTDPTTHFIGRDTSSDIRRYQLNFYTTFGPSMTSLFRGLLSEDWGVFAPRAGSRRTGPVYPNSGEIKDGTMTGTPIDPNASFSVQLYAAVFGMALIPETYDRSFIERSRIFVRGGAESVALDPRIPTVEFTDPNTGLTYVAASDIDDNGNERGIGARMLLRAQALDTRNESVELSRYVDNLNIIRRLTWLLGFGG